MSDTCPTCGVALVVGDWPICGGKHSHARGSAAVIGDDWPGGRVFENGFPEPRTFYSRSEHEQALAERGLEIHAKWAGPNDRHMTNWAAGAVDLEGAEAFVRSHYAPIATPEVVAEYPITVTDIHFEKPC